MYIMYALYWLVELLRLPEFPFTNILTLLLLFFSAKTIDLSSHMMSQILTFLALFLILTALLFFYYFHVQLSIS